MFFNRFFDLTNAKYMRKGNLPATEAQKIFLATLIRQTEPDMVIPETMTRWMAMKRIEWLLKKRMSQSSKNPITKQLYMS
jgi:hypothetical protein